MGKNGYRHYQIRLVASNDGFFEWCKDYCPTAHVEEATKERGDYERKSGNFICSEDTPAIRSVRYGVLRETQKEILNIVEGQNDRELHVFIDSTGGNRGKTWLTIYLWERARALVVPRSETTPSKISAFVCSAYRGEPYVVIDIPRSGKWTDEMYEALEELKDGLVFDHRYSGHTRNIRGVKLIVFCNTEPTRKKLSKDRWVLYRFTGLGDLVRDKS